MTTDSLTTNPIEFDCQDCRCHVYSFGRMTEPLPIRCSVCAWVNEYVADPEEARRIRARLGDDNYLPGVV
jgi:hypothetical protein